MHSDANQAGLETIRKLLDGRSNPLGDQDEYDDDEFFEHLEEDLDLDSYDHHALAV